MAVMAVAVAVAAVVRSYTLHCNFRQEKSLCVLMHVIGWYYVSLSFLVLVSLSWQLKLYIVTTVNGIILCLMHAIGYLTYVMFRCHDNYCIVRRNRLFQGNCCDIEMSGWRHVIG